MMATLNETPSVEPTAYAGLSPAMWRYVGIAAILAIACVLPFAVSGYRVSQFSQVLIYAIAMLECGILQQVQREKSAFLGQTLDKELVSVDLQGSFFALSLGAEQITS
jgi:hypothetical protein